jgi:hypothetical protein
MGWDGMEDSAGRKELWAVFMRDTNLSLRWVPNESSRGISEF